MDQTIGGQVVLPLLNTIQPHPGGKPYDWGEKGPDSYIARLLNIQDVDPNQPFSELWMGTHPEGESQIQAKDQNLSLSRYIAKNPVKVLGQRVAAEYKNKLPFLLKVLSAAEILSIQVHPNKNQATSLRRSDPEHYPDDNHKPEIAIVLDELSLLAGLKSNETVASLPAQYPELLTLLEQKVFTLASAEAFATLIERGVANPETTSRVIGKIFSRLESKGTTSAQEDIFLKLFQGTPNDISLLTVFFLNHYLLSKNQAVYTPAGTPHAYVKGNIIECMANSDMVIRVGPTSKFRDIRALRDTVTDAQPLVFTAQNGNYTYFTPAREFRVSKYELNVGEIIINKGDCARIILIIEGEVAINTQEITTSGQKGSSFFLPSTLQQVTLKCRQKSQFFIVDTPTN